MAGNQASKGIPTKARNPQRKVRRARNLAIQAERKLRHMLKRNGLRYAFDWANQRDKLSTLRKLRPLYPQELRALGVNA